MNRKLQLLTVVVAIICLSITDSSLTAKGKGNGGGGGGGGGGGSSLDYQIVHLDDLNGTLTSSGAYDINDQREIVGNAGWTDPNMGDQSFPVYWTVVDGANGVQTTAHLLPDDVYDGTTVWGINNDSEIVGQGYRGSLVVGLYWPTPFDQPLKLPPLPGDNGSQAFKVNADGIICGWSYLVEENPDGSLKGTRTPAVWEAGVEIVSGVPTATVSNAVALPVPADHRIRSVSRINDLDTDGVCYVVGSTLSPSLIEVPVRWSVASTPNGLVVDPNVEPLDVEGRANGVNNLGDVCGVSMTISGWEGTVWSGANKYVLDRAKFIGITRGFDINDSGVVVGEGPYEKRGVFYYFRAGVWETPQSDMILLDKFLTRNSPLLSLTSADAVNAGGDIAGGGWTGGEFKAYLAIRR